ncbi:MAG: glucokinase [Proteobacteria bacterium]|nr:glucokinase [Pseudomonadota bacterium]
MPVGPRQRPAEMKPPARRAGQSVLAGDVGGTKTVLALYAPDAAGSPCTLRRRRFTSLDYQGLAAMVDDFLEAGDDVAAAAFGLAGPVRDERCHTTNLAWVIDAAEVARETGIPRVSLLNDFCAAALGIGSLGTDDVAILQQGEVDDAGPVAILGAGTGLGEALLVRTSAGPHAVASQGGHVDFAPRNELEMRLLAFLLKRYATVSVERVVSGLGLENIYEFLVTEGLAEANPEIEAAIQQGDAGSVIGSEALRGGDRACVQAVDLFVSLYGAEAGNLALKALASGGVYLAGGIAPKLLDKLRQGPFLESFLAKGRMRPVLERFPVIVVLNQDVGLLGARARALGLPGTP